MTTPLQSDVSDPGALQTRGRVHVLGAGPVGLLTAALLQANPRYRVRLYEKRSSYSRTRMVQLAQYLVADSVEHYRTDYIDEDSIQAIFEHTELVEGIAFRKSIAPDLMQLLLGWTRGFCPLNDIENALNTLINTRDMPAVERVPGVISLEALTPLLMPGDVLIDCTGTKSVLRNHLTHKTVEDDEEANTFKLRLEYAIVVTFLYGEPYDCNEFCKYYKNIDNLLYKFIPAVNRTYYDGRTTHVTGIVNIPAEDYERMPVKFDGQWLRENFPEVARSMDRFIAQIHLETHGEIVGDLDIVRIPLDLYHARSATNRDLRHAASENDLFARTPAFLVGDASMGSPYFQSISLGFECAMYLAGMLSQATLSENELLDRYEQFAYKQWLRVYMRSKMIKHNKDLFERIGDPMALLEKLHIY